MNAPRSKCRVLTMPTPLRETSLSSPTHQRSHPLAVIGWQLTSKEQGNRGSLRRSDGRGRPCSAKGSGVLSNIIGDPRRASEERNYPKRRLRFLPCQNLPGKSLAGLIRG